MGQFFILSTYDAIYNPWSTDQDPKMTQNDPLISSDGVKENREK